MVDGIISILKICLSCALETRREWVREVNHWKIYFLRLRRLSHILHRQSWFHAGFESTEYNNFLLSRTLCCLSHGQLDSLKINFKFTSKIFFFLLSLQLIAPATQAHWPRRVFSLSLGMIKSRESSGWSIRSEEWFGHQSSTMNLPN